MKSYIAIIKNGFIGRGTCVGFRRFECEDGVDPGHAYCQQDYSSELLMLVEEENWIGELKRYDGKQSGEDKILGALEEADYSICEVCKIANPQHLECKHCGDHDARKDLIARTKEGR